MTKNYARPILDGDGRTDYARYMRTDALLSLQRRPEQMVHRDELLFQTVHQSTELWLKLAGAEAAEAVSLIGTGDLLAAERILGRSSMAVTFVTDQLEMLALLTPWTFQRIRTVLGHGSGFESPGWIGIQRVGRDLDTAFAELIEMEQADLAEVYRKSPDAPLYRLGEALIGWDERIALWRTRHYKIATRIIGHDVVGTKGTQVDTLTKLIVAKFFPRLWQVRTQLTRTGPMENGSAENIDAPRKDSREHSP
jgi:tryptophan 2,3-dioxygenase